MSERYNTDEIIIWPDGSNTALFAGATVTMRTGIEVYNHEQEPKPEPGSKLNHQIQAEPETITDFEPAPAPKARRVPAPPRSLVTGVPEEDFPDYLFMVENPKEIEWQQRAVCAQTDPDAFFPEQGESNAAAKRICLGCEVKEECLRYALEHDERFGIWGGMSERQRRKLKK